MPKAPPALRLPAAASLGISSCHDAPGPALTRRAVSKRGWQYGGAGEGKAALADPGKAGGPPPHRHAEAARSAERARPPQQRGAREAPGCGPAEPRRRRGPHLPLQVQHVDGAGRHRAAVSPGRPHTPFPLPAQHFRQEVTTRGCARLLRAGIYMRGLRRGGGGTRGFS